MSACTIHTAREPEEIFYDQIELERSLSGGFGGYSDIKRARLKIPHPQEKVCTLRVQLIQQLMGAQIPLLIAIKCFRSRSEHDSETPRSQLIQEELLVWKILNDCPNILDLRGIILGPDLGTYKDQYIPPYPVSEYHEFGSLNSFLRQKHRDITGIQRLQLLVGVIRGITFIHSKSIVHGDLKADNVVVNCTVDGGYIAKICDFGSSHSNCNDCYKGSKDKDGTLQWNSPEIRRGEPGTAKSDVWSFGCVALEVQFEKTPYSSARRSAMSMMAKPGCLPATLQYLGRTLEATESSVWDVMQKCWQWEPENRPDARGVLDHLRSMLEEHGATVQNPVVP